MADIYPETWCTCASAIAEFRLSYCGMVLLIPSFHPVGAHKPRMEAHRNFILEKISTLHPFLGKMINVQGHMG